MTTQDLPKCLICGAQRATHGLFCQHHNNAHQNILNGFERWRKAYGGMEWNEYLIRLKETPGVGTWTIQVIEHLEKSGGLGGN